MVMDYGGRRVRMLRRIKIGSGGCLKFILFILLEILILVSKMKM
jgi:hypothetical protein